MIPHKRYDEALAEYRKGLALDPLSGIINANYGYGLMVAKRFEESRAQFQKTLETDSTFQVGLRRSADLEAYLGNYDGARQIYLRTSLPPLKQMNFPTPKENYYRARIEAARNELGVETARAIRHARRKKQSVPSSGSGSKRRRRGCRYLDPGT